MEGIKCKDPEDERVLIYWGSGVFEEQREFMKDETLGN
jgi:hypothetical protein